MLFISFNPAMLAAVQAGRKTVTRRRLAGNILLQQQPGRYRYRGLSESGAVFEDVATQVPLAPVPCPFGQPGDLLQVKENPALHLQIVSIRAERVQALTEADAVAEGIECREQQGQVYWGGVEPSPPVAGEFRWYNSPRAAFRGLLAGIYSTAWARNEWVWVVSFRPQPTHQITANQ
ncbi:hypothetical protein [Hymenobacter sp. UYP22]|uniref:hypothetical protein n=1 Tax=Hymenobacter sp. UYP22 TaxID=3156348 RepID=UPI0033984492